LPAVREKKKGKTRGNCRGKPGITVGKAAINQRVFSSKLRKRRVVSSRARKKKKRKAGKRKTDEGD